MAKVVITLRDAENGHVDMTGCQPPIPKLLELRKADALTPAMEYAIIAIAAMMKDSNRIQQEQIADARKRVPLVFPRDPGFTMPPDLN